MKLLKLLKLQLLSIESNIKSYHEKTEVCNVESVLHEKGTRRRGAIMIIKVLIFPAWCVRRLGRRLWDLIWWIGLSSLWKWIRTYVVAGARGITRTNDWLRWQKRGQARWTWFYFGSGWWGWGIDGICIGIEIRRRSIKAPKRWKKRGNSVRNWFIENRVDT